MEEGSYFVDLICLFVKTYSAELRLDEISVKLNQFLFGGAQEMLRGV